MGEAMPAPARRAAARDARAPGAAAVYFPACVNRIFGNPRERPRRPVAGRGAARGLRAGRPAAVDPARRRRPLLRDAVELEGLSRPATSTWRAAIAEAVAALDRRRAAAARRRRELVHAGAARGGAARRSTRTPRERFEQVEIIDSIAWVHDSLLLGARGRRRVGSRGRAPALRRASSSGSRRSSRRSPRALAEEVIVPARRRPAAERPATAACCTPSFPPPRSRARRRGALGRAAERLPVAATAPARSGSQQVTGRPYGSFVLLLEELTRGRARAARLRRAPELAHASPSRSGTSTIEEISSAPAPPRTRASPSAA